MPPLTKYGFIDRVLAWPQGQIVLANLINGLAQGLFGRLYARNVVESWMNEFHLTIGKHYSKGLPVARERKELMGCLDSIKKRFRLTCLRRPRRTCRTSGFGTVIHAGTLIAHYMSEDDRRRLSALGVITGLSMSAPVSQTDIDALMSLKGSRVNLRPNQIIGNPESVLWVTPLENIQKHLGGT